LGALEIIHLNFGMGSKKHGFFRVCGHRPRPLLGQNFKKKLLFPVAETVRGISHKILRATRLFKDFEEWCLLQLTVEKFQRT